jgi:predicted RNase H-like HicB family nuclease
MAPLSEVLVIVHPEGGMDRYGAGYWTEVVDLPVCFEQARGVDEVIAATEAAVRARLAREPDYDPAVKITIEYAF